MNFKLFNHVLKVRATARWPFTHFKVYRHEFYRHIVWGKLSIIFGQPHLEEVGFCACCDSPNIGEVDCGDEGWTVCPDCGAVEQGYVYRTLEEAEALGLL